MTDREPAYRLTLCPEPGPVPPAVRLRQVLKTLLRRHGLRCIQVEQLPAEGQMLRNEGGNDERDSCKRMGRLVATGSAVPVETNR